MEPKEENKLDADNALLLSAEQDSNTPEKPIDEETNNGYDSAADTGNSNEDLELTPDDDPDTNLDENDLDALNGQDIDNEDDELF